MEQDTWRRGPGGAKRVLVDDRNLVFDAIRKAAAATPFDPKQIGTAEKVIRGLDWAEQEHDRRERSRRVPASEERKAEKAAADLHCDGSPWNEVALSEKVSIRAAAYRQSWPGSVLSPTDLAANWTRLV